jgi:hypothetical protein
MTWHTIPTPGTSTTNRFSGDWSNKVSNMFAGVDISDVVVIHSNVTWEFPDDALLIVDVADNTKILHFDLSGITTLNTRNLIIPDEDITLGNGVEGNQPKWVPASEMFAQGIAPAAYQEFNLTSNDVARNSWDFDTTTEENIGFIWVPPTNWDFGVITVRFYWTNDAGLTTETVDWEIKARALQDSSAIDSSWGTGIQVTDTWLAQNDMHISDQTADVTIGGSPAGINPINFNIARKVATDDITGDAMLLGVVIEYSWRRSTQEVL